MNAPATPAAVEPQVLGTVRASSWAGLFDCALRWYYQNIEGLRRPASGAMIAGTAIHAATGVFDAEALRGNRIAPADAEGVLADTIHRPNEDVEWDDDLPPAKAETIGRRLVVDYCTTIAPIRLYTAVEVQCRSLIITTPSGAIRVTGTTDRIRLLADGRRGISDFKSGRTAVGADGKAKLGSHHLQTGIYRLMAEYESGMPMRAPDEIVGFNIAKSPRIGTAEFGDTKTPLVGTADKAGLIEIAAGMLRSGVFPPNPSSFVCGPKYCPAYGTRCHFHG